MLTGVIGIVDASAPARVDATTGNIHGQSNIVPAFRFR